MSTWKKCKKVAKIDAKPWVEGQSMEGITVWDGDTPESGGMIVRQQHDHNDIYYCSPDQFKYSTTGETDGEWTEYKKDVLAEARPYEMAEDMAGISVTEGHKLVEGGMILRQIGKEHDQRYLPPEVWFETYVWAEEVPA